MMRLQALRVWFDLLQMKESGMVEGFYNRTILIVNQLHVNGEDISDKRVLEKILRSMTRKYEHVVVAIEESKDLNTFFLEELFGSKQSHELRIKQFDSSPSEQVFQVQDTSRGGFRGGFRGRGERRSFRGRGQGRENVQSENFNSYQRGRGRARGGFNGRGRGNSFNSFNFQCHYCRKIGNIKKDCYKRINDEKDSNFLHEDVQEKDESMLLVRYVQEESLDDVWYIDSCYSNHMTGNKNCYVNFDESVQREVKTGNNNRLVVKGCGDVPIQINQGTNYIFGVYYVLDLKHNLLNVGKLLRKGHNVNFKDDFVR
ncbi:uncharacterized protein LOC141673923 [Apium graveolens]|uniref:uncharacterized protein LOC141673923 n=1 Tax=Apium graveolens TaxID=4045 RepID=UPI003D78D35F